MSAYIQTRPCVQGSKVGLPYEFVFAIYYISMHASTELIKKKNNSNLYGWYIQLGGKKFRTLDREASVCSECLTPPIQN